MVIPSNLLTVNNPIRLDATEQILPTASVGGLPNNLLRINTSEISASFQSLAGNIPSINTPKIPQFAILNSIIPDNLFATGSIDQVRARTLGVVTSYINGLPSLPTIPSIPAFIIPKTRIPSYGDIKNYIKTKIDRIKLQRQQASIKALNAELKKQENPFKYRQSLKNQGTQNTVLGRFNNQ
jgi:hypothetical protein